jgi:translation initiation factor IF-2
MTERDLAEASQLSIDDVFEAMLDCDLDRLHNLEAIKLVTSSLQRKFEVIKNPRIIEIESVVDVAKLLQQHAIPIGKSLKDKIPVVTIMGHVDHGKTTLLDALRESEIVKQEFGGITQHIGAFVVSLDDQKEFKRALQSNKKPGFANKRNLQLELHAKEMVTFLDTPGHAAFSGMRERGTQITDLVVLVVAADDGVMQQTIESVEFARQNKVPIIVAINKIDRIAEGDSKDHLTQIKEGLRSIGVELEDFGGDIQSVPISALKQIGLNDMKEAICALAESLELKAPVDGGVRATIIESSLDEHRGKLTTLLVQSGTLKKGDVLLSENGNHLLKVRAMFDEYSNALTSAKPGVPVQVIGWKEPPTGTALGNIGSGTFSSNLPNSGERLIQVRNESSGKQVQSAALNELLSVKAKEFSAEGYRKLESDRVQYQKWLEDKRKNGNKYHKMRTANKKLITFDEQEERKRLNVILKADTYGTLETLLDILDSYPGEHGVKINIVHYGVGPVSDGDLNMASCFYETRVYAFNVPGKLPPTKHSVKAYNVIYHLIEDLKSEISNCLPEVEKHHEIGEAVVMQQFLINEKNKKYPVAGCRCNKGTLKYEPNSFYKLIRNDRVVAEQLRLVSMRHLKDEVTSIRLNTECGLRFENSTITFQPNDLLVNYEPKKVKQKTNWTPKGFV